MSLRFSSGLVGMCASATDRGQVEPRGVKIDHRSLTHHSPKSEKDLHLYQVCGERGREFYWRIVEMD